MNWLRALEGFVVAVGDEAPVGRVWEFVKRPAYGLARPGAVVEWISASHAPHDDLPVVRVQLRDRPAAAEPSRQLLARPRNIRSHGDQRLHVSHIEPKSCAGERTSGERAREVALGCWGCLAQNVDHAHG